MAQQAFGLSGIAWAWLRQQELNASPPKPQLVPETYDLTPKSPAVQPQATAMISMFMQGGPSHIDLFDPKPELEQAAPAELSPETSSTTTPAKPAASSSAARGSSESTVECGMDLSELVPHLGAVADDICLIRSMHTGVNNHGQSINALNTGRHLPGRPSLGSWLHLRAGQRERRICRRSSC